MFTTDEALHSFKGLAFDQQVYIQPLHSKDLDFLTISR